MNSVAGQQNLISLLPRLLYVVGKTPFLPGSLVRQAGAWKNGTEVKLETE